MSEIYTKILNAKSGDEIYFKNIITDKIEHRAIVE